MGQANPFQVVGSMINAAGQIFGSQASASASKFNSGIMAQNAKIQAQNATLAAQAGEQSAANKGLESKERLGSITVNEGASGIGVNSGSDVNVRASQQEVGKLDALTVRANAVKEAYGYEVQSQSATQQSQLDRAQASADLTAGYFNAGSTLLNSAGNVWVNYQQSKSPISTGDAGETDMEGFEDNGAGVM